MAPLLNLLVNRDDGVHVEIEAARPDLDAEGQLAVRTSNDSRWNDLPPGFRALVIRAPTSRGTAEHWLDLSEGSADRKLAARLIAQKSVRFLWRGDDPEDAAVLEISDWIREQWTTALRDTVGTSAAAWAWRVAEAKWAQSPSWRPDRPMPPKARDAALAAGLPEDGAPEVAGMMLPAGQRLPRAASTYWATDAAPDDPATTATHLASAFSGVGLWPILWAWDDDPASYLGGHPVAPIPSDLDAATVLAAARHADGGLRASSPVTGARSWRDAPNAFADLDGQRLLVVPCLSPADALHVLDWESGGTPIALLTVLLRSWERRFAAVPVQLEPSAVTLHVGAPPADAQGRAEFVSELAAVADGGRDPTMLVPGARIVIAPRDAYPPGLLALSRRHE